MGLRGIPETVVDFHGLVVPDAMVLRAPGGWRRGFARLIDAYNGQRVGAATVALGLAAGAHARAVQYAKERHQFGRPIAEFQGLQWMLADAAIEISAARALIHEAARSAERPDGAGFPCPVATAKAKVFASEMAIRVTNIALQVWGSAGYSRNNPMERYARDARMFTIAGGTAQILRNLVAADLLGMKLPQTRDGYSPRAATPKAAE
jgi:alkylation response protein AidB-like acyl-CoA dehydrogenase